MLIGDEGVQALRAGRVCVLGLGGVGGAAAEAICRAGVGEMLIIDGDVVDATNLNRQIIATTHNVGRLKAEVCAERLLSINPQLKLSVKAQFVKVGDDAGIVAFKPDYVIDCIDMVSAKLYIIECCRQANIPVLSCMGTGGRLETAGFEVTTIEQTVNCPLARVMRKELKARGIAGVEVLTNKLPPHKGETAEGARHAPGSISFVPPFAGYMAAGHVVNRLLKNAAKGNNIAATVDNVKA